MPTAIVIGASSGIGRAIAELLHSRGFRVGIASRNAAALKEIAGSGEAQRWTWLACDVTDTDAAVRAFAELSAELGTIDFVYLVAGTGFPNPGMKWEWEESTVAVNCVGFAAMAVAALRVFDEQRHGHLVAITSVAAVRSAGGAPAYGASKAFQSEYVSALRYRVMKKKLPVHVTEVRPGFVDTPMMKADKPFWVVDAKTAALGIVAAVDRRKRCAYVPQRWWWVALLLRAMPDWIYARVS